MSSPDGQRRVYGARVVSGEEGQLEPSAAAFVAGVPVLAWLGTMHPVRSRQEGVDLLQVLVPDGDVDVAVGAGYPAGIQVDSPAAEHPVVQVVLNQ
jgi:hypothetical protein